MSLHHSLLLTFCRADSTFLNGNGIMAVPDVNENYSGAIASDNEQERAEAEQAKTDRVSLWDIVLDPDSAVAYYWMALVTLAVLYNLAIIILRLTFSDMAAHWASMFLLFDTICDVIYLFDIIIQFRVAYYDDGCLEVDPKKLAINYRSQSRFVADVISILPLQYTTSFLLGLLGYVFIHVEFIYVSTLYIPLLRLPRLIKTYIVVKFFEVTDSRTSTPNRIRAIKLSLYLWLVIHWIGCVYYMLSEFEGRGSNEWVYPSGEEFDSFIRKYIRCLYWSMLILTTIGERPSPCTDLEYVFTGMTFVIGVFVFAAVVGNVGDVISNMNASRQDYQARMDQIKFYMNHRHVPESLQNRVKRWAEYSWTRTQAIDEPHLLQLLPERLRTEIAIQVHLKTLKKVKLFEECEEGLLRELVLKLKPQTFSPRDYICRKGEIGKEMFIINHGQVEILVPGPEDGKKIVVSKLVTGNYFGEISLLKLDEGHNRRTADVRSVGYSELLCLSRKDLTAALAEYPDAKRILEKSARERMLKTKTVTKIKDCIEEESKRPIRKDKSRKRRDFYDVVKTPEFKSLATKQVPEMDDLRKVVADLKNLGDKISKLQAEKDRDKIIRSLKRKLQQTERELQEAYDKITCLELALNPHQQKNCPCDDEFCISPTNQNPNMRLESRKHRVNTCSLETLPTQDYREPIARLPISCYNSTGIQTLPASYRVPHISRELPNLSLFQLRPRKGTSESRQQNGSKESHDPSVAEGSRDVSDQIRTSSGYSSDTETMALLLHTSRNTRLESSSDQSENIPISTSNFESDSTSSDSTDDKQSFFSRDLNGIASLRQIEHKAPKAGKTVEKINYLNSSNKRKSITVRMRETPV
ncbi:cyclic nucleotide-gated cation channel alpha-3-like [Saccostrea echinata]|uniref:cyclic nucleotide-gated cation channel alpha-3-like n=1 Tax=Saccostrea echinata TaxID=191078 RepID=UPI002A83A19A|nr:cyclic nucleotide-gated cation channel alpha-3-like [Saccostrea echinata]